jgi:hypothetical protein
MSISYAEREEHLRPQFRAALNRSRTIGDRSSRTAVSIDMCIEVDGGNEGHLGFGDGFLKDGSSRSANPFIGPIVLWNHPLRTDRNHRCRSYRDHHIAVAAYSDCVSIGRYVWSDNYVVGLGAHRTRSPRPTAMIVERMPV